VLGFAVVHAITRGMGGRTFVLGALYVASLIYGLPVLAMAILGLVDLALDVRSRVARRRGPPDVRT
jgi:hypothetical protein